MHVEVVVVAEGAVPVDAVEEVVPAVGGVVAVVVGVHGVEVLRHVIEVDDQGVERDCGIIPPQGRTETCSRSMTRPVARPSVKLCTTAAIL